MAICNQLPNLKKVFGKGGKVTLISSGENLPITEHKYLLNLNELSVLGVQEFMIEQDVVKLLNFNYFETLNLGEMRDELKKCEPLLRNSEYVVIDMMCMKHSDFAPSTNPNGFTAEEMSQISHYIGCSLNLKGIILYGVEKGLEQSCYNLIAQLCWITSNSLINNIIEDPADAYKNNQNSANFKHYVFTFDNDSQNIVFISSQESGRIWMEVPIVKKNKNVLIPCSNDDFRQAMDKIIPNRWLMHYSKYNI